MSNPNCDKLGHLTTGTRVMCAECYNKQANAVQRVRELAKKFGDYDEFAEQFNTFTGTQIEDEILKALDGEQ